MNTICAVSTPPGIGGIAVIRVSGGEAIDIVSKIWRGKKLSDVKSHTVHLGRVLDIASKETVVLDQCVATVYRGPKSFTGEDVVELAVHGSVYVQQQLINSLIRAGASLAQPGEFTRRAFASGKMDLAQAEAVADLIASENRASHRIAMNQMRGAFSARLNELRQQLIEIASLLELELDFSEEDVEFASREQLLSLSNKVKTEVERLAKSFHEGQAIKNGIPVAIIGATNAGKSSLLNALLGDDRAIVSDVHGTTRDIVEDSLRIGDYSFRIMDTAGLRRTDDEIETIGIERSLNAAEKADISIVVVDAAAPVAIEMPATLSSIVVAFNKIDLLEIGNRNIDVKDFVRFVGQERVNEPNIEKIWVSSKTGEGVNELKALLENIAARGEMSASSVLVTNARHYEALIAASDSITRVIDGISQSLTGDLISLDLRATIDSLGSIIGEVTNQEVLSSIFSRFCIGK